jgi:hypothetical protein
MKETKTIKGGNGMKVEMKNNKNNDRFSIEISNGKSMLYWEFRKKVQEICGNKLDVDMIRTKECANFQVNPGTVGYGDDRIIEFFPYVEYSAEYVAKHGRSPFDVTPISA